MEGPLSFKGEPSVGCGTQTRGRDRILDLCVIKVPDLKGGFRACGRGGAFAGLLRLPSFNIFRRFNS